jgi:hypothetical protein
MRRFVADGARHSGGSSFGRLTACAKDAREKGTRRWLFGRHPLNEADELVSPIALVACEEDELFRFRDDGALLWGSGDGDASAASDL